MTATILGLALLMVSCDESTTTKDENPGGQAALQITLTDAPADYTSVLIDVVGLEYRIEIDSVDDDEEEDSGNDRITDESQWHTAEITPQVYDLLTLNNGAEAILTDLEVAEGELEAIRLILGDNNQLVIGEDTTALTVPSGGESGLKVKIDAEIEDGKNYKLVLDFDAAKSVVAAGNSGQYLLKPVIRAHFMEVEEESEYGAIGGVVWPDSISSVVYVIDDEDSISTTPETDGTFFIDFLEEDDDYSVVAVPAVESGFTTVSVSDIQVMQGMTTALDTLFLGTE